MQVVRLVLLIAFCSFFSLSIYAQTNADFSSDYERIYQIRVVSPEAGSKSSIGSGFQVSADGLIMTNYHVVSGYVNSPENFEIKYVAQNGEKGVLELIDFDVISDLAVLRHPKPSTDYFSISSVDLEKGETAYALGNPGDWGVIMVSGPTNGFVEHSYENRVLFSGSLNPGMSGGPSLNAAGKVIGVNVATAGSQLSFLVPADKAARLLERNKQLAIEDYQQEITEQLKKWQHSRISGLLEKDWVNENFSDRELFGEIRHDFQCWGWTNESNKDRKVASVRKNCRAGDDVYLARNLDAGQIRFSFESSKPIKLNSLQFSKLQHTTMGPDNNSNYEGSTNYSCESDFIKAISSEKGAEENGFNRVITCIRAYKKMKGLYDSLILLQHHQKDESFKAHLSLSALEKEQIIALNQRFIEEVL